MSSRRRNGSFEVNIVTATPDFAHEFSAPLGDYPN